jgi:hypothetical protein
MSKGVERVVLKRAPDPPSREYRKKMCGSKKRRRKGSVLGAKD